MDTSLSEDETPEPEEPTKHFEVDVTADDPTEPDRHWLESITTLLCQRSQEKDPSDRVQYALDMMFIASCERVVRLMRSDLDVDQPDG
jgi:hypothetical protein